MSKKINQVLRLLQLMQYSERTNAAQEAVLTVINDKECKADNKRLYDSFEDGFSMFEYLNAKCFAWSTVFSDEITEINSRLDKIEAMLKEKDDSNNTNDPDINIGGF